LNEKKHPAKTNYNPAALNQDKNRRLQLFEATGVELEYMIVDSETLDVKPICDHLLREASGSGFYVNEVERGRLAWSNELALHLIELKTNGPARHIADLHNTFQQQVREINDLLEPHNARLMPSAMHPWMDPDREMKLWPHEYNPIYEAYNRIFDCRGHGWANLQSMHINLPFDGNEQFAKLHAAVRILLPLLPGLAAGSPIADSRIAGYTDYRLEVYRTNSKVIPSVTGHIIPEAVFSREEYETQIFQKMYNDIKPFDPDEILQEEWLNSRGAIARFDRGSIEIRVIDIQECPLADLAIVRMVIDVLNQLTAEAWSTLERQKSWNEQSLYAILLDVMKSAEKAVIPGCGYLDLFGVKTKSSISVSELWRELFNRLYTKSQVNGDPVLQCMDLMISHGSLSTRILKALPKRFTKPDLKQVYGQLCECLQEGKLFIPDV